MRNKTLSIYIRSHVDSLESLFTTDLLSATWAVLELLKASLHASVMENVTAAWIHA